MNGISRGGAGSQHGTQVLRLMKFNGALWDLPSHFKTMGVG